jgi:hypothetical protein
MISRYARYADPTSATQPAAETARPTIKPKQNLSPESSSIAACAVQSSSAHRMSSPAKGSSSNVLDPAGAHASRSFTAEFAISRALSVVGVLVVSM